MKRAIVLGCGPIGSAMVRDLAADQELRVVAVDADESNLDALSSLENVTGIRRDLSDPRSVRELVSEGDVVLGALPSRLGLATLHAVLEAGKPYADVSFMSEDPLSLDSLAREKGVTAVVDCGVAPGLASMVVGHCSAEMDEIERVEIYVGGLPRSRYRPYEYKAAFAPLDVIEEYTRPARMVENGRVVVKPALSEPELVNFPEAGTLEAFNTDGLRSMIRTIKAGNMKEKTLRYPGHRDLMCVLRETGFFSKEEIEFEGGRVAPLDLTARLLFPLWALNPGEREFTVLRVLVEGRRGGRRLRHCYDLYDEYDEAKEMTSMARTTGFTCAIVARLLGNGTIRMPGVQPPEMLGMKPGVLAGVTAALSDRNVLLRQRVEKLV